MFFEIIGKIVVFFIVFVFLLGLYGKFWLKRKVKKFAEEVSKMQDAQTGGLHSSHSQGTTVEASSVSVSLIKRSNYVPSSGVEPLLNEFNENGFESISWYEVPEMQSMNILGLHKEGGVFAVIYDNTLSAYYELISETSNGTVIVVSTAPDQVRPHSAIGKNINQVAHKTKLGDALSLLKIEAVSGQNKLFTSDFESIFLRSFNA